jgi:hypothetical protein
MSGLRWWWVCLSLLVTPAAAQEDLGKETVGAVSVRVYYATNGDPEAGKSKKQVPATLVKRLRSESKLKFASYRELGSDTRPLFRSYENWAQPLGTSDEVLVRFEAQSRPSASAARLGLELWLSRKKVLKTDATVTTEKPLYVLGPQWRGGRLIIAVALAPKQKRGS